MRDWSLLWLVYAAVDIQLYGTGYANSVPWYGQVMRIEDGFVLCGWL